MTMVIMAVLIMVVMMVMVLVMPKPILSSDDASFLVDGAPSGG